MELKRELVADHERVFSNRALALPPKEFELAEAEVARIPAALGTWSRCGASTGPRSLEPPLHAVSSGHLL